jgi:hypothetical protein
MKKILPLCLASSLLLSACSKSSDDPTPATPISIQGTWTLTAGRTIVTSKNGGAVTTSDRTITPGSITVIYGANGSYQASFNGVVQSTGTYLVSGTSLTITTGSSLTSTISELTANKLVLTVNMEDNDFRYAYVDSSVR